MVVIPTWLQAGLWGLMAGSALFIGSVIGYWARISQRVIAGIMAFGSGVLISALSFELMDNAYDRGGFGSTAAGFMAGAVIFTFVNKWLNAQGAKHRKCASGRQCTEDMQKGSGTAIAVGALLDGIPESIAIGVSMIEGGAVGIVAVIAIFLSNIPEGLSSSAGMKKAGRSKGYIFGVWAAIAIASGIAAWAGYSIFSGFSPFVTAATIAVAAGGILAMLVDTMIPEAFEKTHDYAGLITVTGFLCAYVLSKAVE